MRTAVSSWLRFMLLALVACGGKNGSSRPPATGATVTSVAVSPVAASVAIGSSLAFTAVVNGTGAFDGSLLWSVQGVAGGSAAVGTITASGLYVTPYPAPDSVTVTATSRANPAVSGDATVTIVPPPPGQGPDLVVDAAAARRPISRLIYGMNRSLEFPRLASELRLPLERWGGDATTRYNWKLDVTNSANDWYFSTDPNANTGYPDESEFNDMVARDQASGTLSMGTIPMVGWTTRRERACGFSVAKYGPHSGQPVQQRLRQRRPARWLDILADPTDTSVPIGPEFGRAWARTLSAATAMPATAVWPSTAWTTSRRSGSSSTATCTRTIRATTSWPASA